MTESALGLRSPQKDLLSHEDSLLDWFAKTGAQVTASTMQLGGFKYHHFQCQWTRRDGQVVSSFGSDEDRRTAAIKCAAELVERITMRNHFSNSAVPHIFQNSNGWAVQFSQDLAAKKAQLEATERHLLLRSYFSFGWHGFDLIFKIKSPEVDLYFLGSRFVADGLRAGLVVAKSPLYPGVSFGYTVGNVVDLGRTDFWKSAIFESVDKLLNLQGQEFQLTKNASWIHREAHHYLTTPFDLALVDREVKAPVIPCTLGEIDIQHFDLSEKMNLNFPLFAAHASGDGLIPLFTKSQLDANSAKLLSEILTRNKITFVPQRHPIQ